MIEEYVLAAYGSRISDDDPINNSKESSISVNPNSIIPEHIAEENSSNPNIS